MLFGSFFVFLYICLRSASKPADTGSEAVASPSPTTTSSHEGSFVKKKFTFRRVFESPKFHRKKFSQGNNSNKYIVN